MARERGNDAKYRQDVYKRAQGKCELCGLDFAWLREQLFPRFPMSDKRAKAIADHPWAEKLYPGDSLFQMDHIQPVVLNGGQRGIENLRCLCSKCHREQTAILRQQLTRKPKKYGKYS